jgi:hypothetical protein
MPNDEERTEIGPRTLVRLGGVIAAIVVAFGLGGAWMSLKSEIAGLRDDMVDSAALQTKATDEMAIQLREINASLKRLDGDKVRVDTLIYWLELVGRANPDFKMIPFPRN